MKLKNICENIAKVNGLSFKQAEKIAYFLLENLEINNSIINSLNNLKKIRKCSFCNNFIDEEVCLICNDQNRKKIIVIVEKPYDINKIENIYPKQYYFFILEKLIQSNKQDYYVLKNLKKLESKINNYDEIIIALSPNLNGLVTANVIKEKFKYKKVTQLSHGIPIGAAMEYVDKTTLKLSLDNRKEV